MSLEFKLISDVHTEQHRDGGASFVQDLRAACPKVQVLVVAGDLAVGEGLTGVVDLLCAKFEHVVYLPGNHEYYRCPRPLVREILGTLGRRHPGFHWLHGPGTEVTIEGRRFLGDTMWFRRDDEAPRDQMNDFFQIPDFEDWVYEENAAAVRYFEECVRPGDVVVSHHLPSPRSITPQYKGSELNAYFLCDVGAVIKKRKPAAWLHGHTHDSLDYRIGKTRVVCSPFGYLREQNPEFSFEATITL